MTRIPLTPAKKPLHWVGSAHKDILGLPRPVQRNFGFSLESVQFGGKPKDAKPWKGDGPGVFEIVEDCRGDTFRAIYTVRFEKAVYVLHVFQKKSRRGIATDRKDQELVASRLRDAQRDYGERYG